jgi:phosphopantetheine adenylyltransferase
MKPDTKIVYIPCNKELEHISSSAIRNLMKFDIELASKYIVK